MNGQYSKSNSERRRYRRVKVNFVISYQISNPFSLRLSTGWNKEVNALMLDISEGGACILTNYNIPPAAVLVIKVALISPGAVNEEQISLIKATADVSYNLLCKKREHRLGICFTDISRKDKKLIANFIKRQP